MLYLQVRIRNKTYEVIGSNNMDIMDRKLKYTKELLYLIIKDFNTISTDNNNITFLIWTEIPTEYEHSYYLNEQLINPVKVDFEKWKATQKKLQNTIYSVAINSNKIVSSVYGSLTISIHSLNYYERSLNLWHTQETFRNKCIGKGVLLNYIKHTFEADKKIIIRAWNITKPSVDTVLVKYGFK